MTLLEAMALSHPEAADLTFESWELGFSSRRMEDAVNALVAIGCVELVPAAAPTHSSRARLTAKGLELLHSQGLGAPQAGDRRRSARDRRAAQVSSPPSGLSERRRSMRDRRHLLAA
jgi:hypothetical protein